MPLMHDQIDDFVELTLNNFKKRSWVDISLDLQHYHFAGRMATFKKTPERGGPELEWKVQVANTGTARFSGLYDTDQTNVKNLMVPAKVPWTKSTVNFSYDVDESVFQTGPETIIEMIRTREHSMYNDWYELMEEALFTKPASSVSSASETREPFGLPYWAVQSTTKGFNGGDPAGFSSGAADIATGTYANWKNYTFGYDTINRSDGIEETLEAMDKTRFMAPHNFSELGGGTPDYCLYTTYGVLQDVRRELQGSNDNLGNDIGRFSGDVVVRGVPMKWVPALTESSFAAYDSNDPIYGVNWRVLSWYFRTGRNMVRSKPQTSANQHSVRTVHMDTWGNFQCLNRRNIFVGRKN